jgi:dephospho-CoA kinase
MFVLGLTGSLGMGKSTTAGLFAEAGVPVHDADAVVHRLYEGEDEGKAATAIEAAFPGTTLAGKVDRDKLAARVLANPAALRALEAIVHPLVRAAEARFLNDARARGAKVVVLDIPLLLETASDQRVDAIVVVSAPNDVQRQRVLERRGMTPDKLDALLARQMADSEKRRHADFVVDTSRGFDAARAQVKEILRAVATMPTRRR